MTQFMQKSFSVYANAEDPKCEMCGKQANMFYVIAQKRICRACYKNEYSEDTKLQKKV